MAHLLAKGLDPLIEPEMPGGQALWPSCPHGSSRPWFLQDRPALSTSPISPDFTGAHGMMPVSPTVRERLRLLRSCYLVRVVCVK